MVGGFLCKTRKICFCVVQIEKTEKNNLQKEWRKTFFFFYDKKKNYFLNLIKPLAVRLTSLIKIHRQLLHVMQIAVWYFICARELFSIWLFHRKLAFVLVIFSLYQDENPQENFLLIFHGLRRGETVVEPAGSASN